jgi:hypothetical protein
LSKWKLFRRSKENEMTPTETTKTQATTSEKIEEKTVPDTPEPEKTPIMEYNETLYSAGSSKRPERKYEEERRELPRRVSWESPRTIEQNIDSMKKTRTEEIYSQRDTNVEKKVDQIFLKKKTKP